MHIPNHYLDWQTAAATAAVAGGAVAWSAWKSQSSETLGWRRFAATSAGIFAAQLFNFSVGGGTSGHLLGGTIAAMLLGPWRGMLSVALVLVVQCLMFGDGGWQALGANVLNMAVAGSLVGYGVVVLAKRWNVRTSVQIAVAGAGAWLAVMTAALLCSLELALAGATSLNRVLPAMLSVHAVIGLGEALATMTVAMLALQFQRRQALAHGSRWGAALGLAAALGIALFLAPLASSSPDGLEHVASTLQIGFAESASSPLALIPHQLSGISSEALQKALCGAIGVLVVFCAALVVRHVAQPPMARAPAQRV